MRTERVSRRTVLKSVAAATVGTGMASWTSSPVRGDEGKGQQIPLKLGVRAATMKMVGDLDVIRTAAQIPGILGVELQVTAGKINLRDWDTVRAYKREADRWGMHIPSLAGVWDKGTTIKSPDADKSVLPSIRAAEMLGAGVILLAFFRDNAPDMNDESSFGPVVEMLKRTAPTAADAGVVMGLENSLSPADNRKLVDLVDHPAVGVYYDLHNMDHYGHGAEAIDGIKLLGKERICMVHVKNGTSLLEEPGPIDWALALKTYNQIGYDGWYVYESSHEDTADCIADTKKNNLFMQRHARMPRV